MIRIFYLALMLVFSCSCSSENKTVKIEKAGSLALQLGDNVDKVLNLKLSGDINGTDILTIKNMKNLSTLDLAEANIVAGGSAYYFDTTKYDKPSYYTIKNVFPKYSFSKYKGSLTSITLPNSITEIGYGAFWECGGLTSITIPNGVNVIGVASFANCAGLTSITIPNGIKVIGVEAFWGCSGISTIELPISITEIGISAFCRCTGLSEIHCKTIMPIKLFDDPYYPTFPIEIRKSCKLFVPKGSMSSYKSARMWDTFTNIIEE